MRRRFDPSVIAAAFSLVAMLATTIVVRSQAQPAAAALPQAWVLPLPAQVPAAQNVAVRAGRIFDPRAGTLLANQRSPTLQRRAKCRDTDLSNRIANVEIINLSQKL
jgi:hypothetical protein